MHRGIALHWDKRIGPQCIVAAYHRSIRQVECAAQTIIAGETQENIALSLCAEVIVVRSAKDQTVDAGINRRKPIEGRRTVPIFFLRQIQLREVSSSSLDGLILGTAHDDDLSAQADGDILLGLAGDDRLSSAFNLTD